MLHVGSAVGLLAYFWRDWIRIIGAFFSSLFKRRIETPSERLAWLIVVATIPVGDPRADPRRSHCEDLFAKPLASAIFLMVNGVILLTGRALAPSRRRARPRRRGRDSTTRGARSLDTLEYREAAIIGTCQSAALLAGISRDGVVMTGGLMRGLDNADAARFGFFLATPPILAAGLLKLHEVTGPTGRRDSRGASVIAADLLGDRGGDHRALPLPVLRARQPAPVRRLLPRPSARSWSCSRWSSARPDAAHAGPTAGSVSQNRTLPLERARVCARSTKSSRLNAARNSRVTSAIRAFSERSSSRPCLASSPKSTVAAIP